MLFLAYFFFFTVRTTTYASMFVIVLFSMMLHAHVKKIQFVVY